MLNTKMAKHHTIKLKMMKFETFSNENNNKKAFKKNKKN